MICAWREDLREMGLRRSILRTPACDSTLAAGAGRREGLLISRSVRRLVRICDKMPQHLGLECN